MLLQIWHKLSIISLILLHGYDIYIYIKKKTYLCSSVGWDTVNLVTLQYQPIQYQLTLDFFLLLEELESCSSFFAGGLCSSCFRFFALGMADFPALASSWRKLSFRGPPVLAARDRIMRVWAAMLILFSLPASLAGLQEGISGVAGGGRCLGVLSPSLLSLCRDGVLNPSVCSSCARPGPGVLWRGRSGPLAACLFGGVAAGAWPCMSCSISAACLVRGLVLHKVLLEVLDTGAADLTVEDTRSSVGRADVWWWQLSSSFSLFAVMPGESCKVVFSDDLSAGFKSLLSRDSSCVLSFVLPTGFCFGSGADDFELCETTPPFSSCDACDFFSDSDLMWDSGSVAALLEDLFTMIRFSPFSVTLLFGAFCWWNMVIFSEFFIPALGCTSGNLIVSILLLQLSEVKGCFGSVGGISFWICWVGEDVTAEDASVLVCKEFCPAAEFSGVTSKQSIRRWLGLVPLPHFCCSDIWGSTFETWPDPVVPVLPENQ